MDKEDKPKMVKRSRSSDYYDRKFTTDEIWFGEGMVQSVDNFIDDFLDGKLRYSFLS
jgi:hypothetical protein